MKLFSYQWQSVLKLGILDCPTDFKLCLVNVIPATVWTKFGNFTMKMIRHLSNNTLISNLKFIDKRFYKRNHPF